MIIIKAKEGSTKARSKEAWQTREECLYFQPTPKIAFDFIFKSLPPILYLNFDLG